jgi:hypothetical protein
VAGAAREAATYCSTCAGRVDPGASRRRGAGTEFVNPAAYLAIGGILAAFVGDPLFHASLSLHS